MQRPLADALDRWVRAGLVTNEEAELIRRFESASPPRRRALLAEVLGSLGAIASAAAAVVGTAVLWPDLTTFARVSIPAGGSLALLAAGAAIHRATDASTRRLASLLWLLGVCAFGAAVAIVGDDVAHLSAQNVAATTGGASLALAVALLVRLPSPHAILATVGAAVCLAVGLVLQYDSARPEHVGAVLLCLGAATALLGWAEVLPETATAILAGATVALVGAEMLGDLARHWPIVAGAAVALGLLVLFVESRDRASLLAGLVIAVVVAVQGIVQLSRGERGGGEANRWVILMVFVVGAAVLTASLAAVRNSTRTRTPA